MFSSRANTIAYLNELLAEMTQLVETPIEYKNSQILLSREITRVWDEFQKTSVAQTEVIKRAHLQYSTTPPPGDQPTFSTPYVDMMTPPTFSTSFITPGKKSSHRMSPESASSSDAEWLNETTQNGCHILQTKIYIPEPPVRMDGKPVKCSYIGRILGPSGMSAKMIERQFDVTLLIRGRGSIRDEKREREMKDKKGFAHLDEPLHVLLIAKHTNRKTCEEILDRAADKIASLLTPVHDELKKDQLLRLSVMNGTYVHRLSKSPASAESSMYYL